MVPETEDEKKAAYIHRFKRWIEKHPEQKYLFCDHGEYCGANLVLNNTPYGCEECQKGA